MGGKTKKRPEKIVRAWSFTNGLMKTYQLIEISGSGKECIVKRINADDKLPLCAGRSDQADIVFGREDKQVSRQQFSINRKGSSLSVQNIGSLPVFFGEKNKSLLPQSSIAVSEAETFHFAGCSLRIEKIQEDKKYLLCLEYDDGRKDKIPLSVGRMTLGRGENNGVIVKAEGVSRDHVSLESLGGGVFRLVDENSKNGVYIYREGVETRISDPVEIRAGERFAFGRVAGRVQEELPVADKKKFIGIAIGVIVAVFVVFSLAQIKKHVAEGPSVPFDRQFKAAWDVPAEENRIQALDVLRNVEAVRSNSNRLDMVTRGVVFLENQQALRALLEEKEEQWIQLKKLVAADPWSVQSYTQTDTDPLKLVEATKRYQASHERFAAGLKDVFRGNDSIFVFDGHQTLSTEAKNLCSNLEGVEARRVAVLGELGKWEQNPSLFLKTEPEWWGEQIGTLLVADKDKKSKICQFVRNALGEVSLRYARLNWLIGNMDSFAQEDRKGINTMAVYPPSLSRQVEAVAPQRAVEVFEKARASRPSAESKLPDLLAWSVKLRCDASAYEKIQPVSIGIEFCDGTIAEIRTKLKEQSEVAARDVAASRQALEISTDYKTVDVAVDSILKYSLVACSQVDKGSSLRKESDEVLQKIRKVCRNWYNLANTSNDAQQAVLKKQIAQISAKALRCCETLGDVDSGCRAEFQTLLKRSSE